MNDNQVVEVMEKKVEEIVREKAQLTYGINKNNEGTSNRETVRQIIKELDKVVDNED